MLLIITRADCPYCAAAKRNLARLTERYAQYRALKPTFLTETEKLRAEYDYYYTPAYFWDKEKLAEGSYTEEELSDLLREAYWRFCGAENEQISRFDGEK